MWYTSQSIKPSKLQFLGVSIVAIAFVIFGQQCGVDATGKRTEGFIRGKMRPMHFSNLNRNFWNMGSPFSQPTSWKPHMRLSPFNSPPIASSLIASENSNNHNGRSGTSAEAEKGKFVPFIGARALSNLPKFFEHLRQNVEIMREQEEKQSLDYPQDEPAENDREKGDVSSGEYNEPRAMAVSSGNQEWMWPAAIFFRGKNLERVNGAAA